MLMFLVWITIFSTSSNDNDYKDSFKITYVRNSVIERVIIATWCKELRIIKCKNNKGSKKT